MTKKRIRKNSKLETVKRVFNWVWHGFAGISLFTEGYVVYLMATNQHEFPFLKNEKQSVPCPKPHCSPERTTLTAEQLKTLHIVSELIRSNSEAARIWHEKLYPTPKVQNSVLIVPRTPVKVIQKNSVLPSSMQERQYGD